MHTNQVSTDRPKICREFRWWLSLLSGSHKLLQYLGAVRSRAGFGCVWSPKFWANSAVGFRWQPEIAWMPCCLCFVVWSGSPEIQIVVFRVVGQPHITPCLLSLPATAEARDGMLTKSTNQLLITKNRLATIAGLAVLPMDYFSPLRLHRLVPY